MKTAIAGGFAFALTVYAPAFAQEFLSGAERDKAIAETREGCAQSLKEDPSLKLDAAAIENYCQCVGVELTAVITKAEADGGTTTPAMQEKMTAVGQKCLPRLKAGLKP